MELDAGEADVISLARMGALFQRRNQRYKPDGQVTPGIYSANNVLGPFLNFVFGRHTISGHTRRWAMVDHFLNLSLYRPLRRCHAPNIGVDFRLNSHPVLEPVLDGEPQK